MTKHNKYRYYYSIKALLFILAAYGFQYTFSQSGYPVSGSAIFKPPYTVNLAEMVQPGAENINLNIIQHDSREPVWQIALQVEISSAEVTLSTNKAFVPTPINIIPGLNTISGSDLAQYFNLVHLNALGVDKSTLERTKNLPEGFYTFTFTVYDYQRRDKILSAPISCMARLGENHPPLLISPSCESIIMQSQVSNLLFTWQSQSDPSLQTEYEFTLVEVPEGVNPNDAINGSAKPHVDKYVTRATSLLYDPALFQPLEPGKIYAWRVKAKDIMGQYKFVNYGYSNTCVFEYGKPYISHVNVSLNTPAHDQNIDFPYQGNTSKSIFLSWDYDKDPTRYQYNLVKLKLIEYDQDDDMPLSEQIKNNYPVIDKEIMTNSYSTALFELEPFKVYAWQVTVYKNNQRLIEDNIISDAPLFTDGLQPVGKSEIGVFKTIPNDILEQNLSLYEPESKAVLPLKGKEAVYANKDDITFSWQQLNFNPPYGEVEYTLNIYEGEYENFNQTGDIQPVYSNKNQNLSPGFSGDVTFSYTSESVGFVKFSDKKYSWGIIAEWDGRTIARSTLNTFEQTYFKERIPSLEMDYNTYEEADAHFLELTEKNLTTVINQTLGAERRTYNLLFQVVEGEKKPEDITDGADVIKIEKTREAGESNLSFSAYEELKDKVEKSKMYGVVVEDNFGVKSNVCYFKILPDIKIDLTSPSADQKFDDRFINFSWEAPELEIQEYILTVNKINPVDGSVEETVTAKTQETKLVIDNFDFCAGNYQWKLEGILTGYGNSIYSDSLNFRVNRRCGYIEAFNGKRPFTKEMDVNVNWLKPSTEQQPVSYSLLIKDIGEGKDWFSIEDFEAAKTEVESKGINEGSLEIRSDTIRYTLQGDETLSNFEGFNKYYYRIKGEYDDGTFIYSDIAEVQTVGQNEIIVTIGGIIKVKDISDGITQNGRVLYSGTGELESYIDEDPIPVNFTNVLIDDYSNLIDGEVDVTFDSARVLSSEAGRFEYTRIHIAKTSAKITGTPVFSPKSVGFTYDEVRGETKDYEYVHEQNGLTKALVKLPDDLDINFRFLQGFKYVLEQNSVIDVAPVFSDGVKRDQTNLTGYLEFGENAKSNKGEIIRIPINNYKLNSHYNEQSLYTPLFKDSVLLAVGDNGAFNLRVNSFKLNFSESPVLKTSDYDLLIQREEDARLNLDPDKFSLAITKQSPLVISKNGVSFNGEYAINHQNNEYNGRISGFKTQPSALTLKIENNTFSASWFNTSVYLQQFDNYLTDVQVMINNEGIGNTFRDETNPVTLAFNTYNKNKAEFLIKSVRMLENTLVMNCALTLKVEGTKGTSTIAVPELTSLTLWSNGAFGYDGAYNASINSPNITDAALDGVAFQAKELVFLLLRDGGKTRYEIGLFGGFNYGFADVSMSDFVLWFKSKERRESFTRGLSYSRPQPEVTFTGEVTVPERDGTAQNSVDDMTSPSVSVSLATLSFISNVFFIENETYGKALYVPLKLPFTFFDKTKQTSKTGKETKMINVKLQWLMGEKDGVDYWLAQMDVDLARRKIPLGKVNITGFVGRVFHHMKYKAGTKPSPISDFSYVPDKNTYAGGYFAVNLEDLDTDGFFMQARVGAEMTFTSGFSPITLRIDGDVTIVNYAQAFLNKQRSDGFKNQNKGVIATPTNAAVDNTIGHSAFHGHMNAEINFQKSSFIATFKAETDGIVLCGGGDAEIRVNDEMYDFKFRIGSKESPFALYPCVMLGGPKGWILVEKRKDNSEWSFGVGAMMHYKLSMSTGKIDLGITGGYVDVWLEALLLLQGEAGIDDGFYIKYLGAHVKGEAGIRVGYKIPIWGWESSSFSLRLEAMINMYFHPQEKWDATAEVEVHVWKIGGTFTVEASGNNYGGFL